MSTHGATRHSTIENCCTACGARMEKPKFCSACHIAKYCSRECQVKDWKENGHSFLCSSKVEIRSTDDAGMGIFALKNICVGEEIHCEKAVLRFTQDEDVDPKITPQKKQLLWTMHDAFNYDGEKSIQGIGRTNGLPTSGSQGLFLLACRLNHACNGAQNARYIWRADLNQMMVRAIRPIFKRQQVTVCYIDPYLCKAERQQKLTESFHFECACAECTTNWSELRDQKLDTIRQTIEDVVPIGEFEPRRALNLCEQLLKILESEDLNTPLDRGRIHFDAFQMAARASDRSEMSFHIKKAHEAWLETDGEGSELDLKGRALMEQWCRD